MAATKLNAITVRPKHVQTQLNNLIKRSVTATVQDLFTPATSGTTSGIMAGLIEDINAMFKSSELNVISNGVHSDYRFGPIIKLFKIVQSKYLMAHPHQSEIFTQDEFAKILFDRIITIDLEEDNSIENIEIVKVHININLKSEYIVQKILEFANYARISDTNPLANFKADRTTNTAERIVMDFSSPNVAKELHFGHLRSTIIGDSLYNLLTMFTQNPETQILCLNHIGDWGTQFGMIINYLRFEYENNFERITSFLEHANSTTLLETYRSAKAQFDADTNFADQSRYQTACLQKNIFTVDQIEMQQIHEENLQIWRMICDTSRSSYSEVYERLGITNSLIERGESFYNTFIPNVIDMLKQANLVYEEESALKIWFDDWEFPFIVVKSDGGYTYAMTDIAAIWHRIFIEHATQIIYITDKGQSPHFEKVFDVAKEMGWLNLNTSSNTTVKLVHIGFGLVSGKDGKKLKTRDGDIIKLIDVINDVSAISERVIRDRAEQVKAKANTVEDNFTNDKYALIDEETILKMSSTIAVNTLKYNDFSYLYGSDYPYDPEKLFEFQGDTGVYQMYCYCRIKSIIEKSSYGISDFSRIVTELIESFTQMSNVGENPDFNDMTKIDRDILVHILGVDNAFESAYSNLSIKPIVDYCKKLTALFSKYVSKQNVKIIAASTEKFRIAVCCTILKILDTIFETLGFGKIDFI